MLTSPPRQSISQAAYGCLALCLLMLAGCASILPLEYAPTSELSARGSVSVAEFRYLPARSGRVEPNQIQNTAWDDLYFDREIGVFFRAAVLQELRRAGVATEHGARALSGEVREFLIDDLGASVDWTIRVLYRVTDGGKTLYEAEKISRRRTAKFGDPSVTLNRSISLNIDELIKDPAFLGAIRAD
jgi:uncharacterized lipoprotein